MSDFFDAEYKVILDALGNKLFDVEFSLDNTVDWYKIFNESCKQTVCSIIFDCLGANENIPGDLYMSWFSSTAKYLQCNVIVNQNHTYLDALMKKNNIPYCILKGAASEYYYPKSSLRAMGDVDFLIPKTHIDRAIDVLKLDGFEMSFEDHDCHYVFKKNKMHMEMHFEPAGMPSGQNGVIAQEYLSNIFENSKYVNLAEASFENPSPFHHGFIILLHTYHHILSEGIGLRHLCDWAVFANSFSNEEFVEIFEEKLSKIGLWRFARILGAVSHKYLNMPYKDWIGNVDDDICLAVISDIFDGGNFGRKQKYRVQQGAMISDRGKNGIKKNKLLQLIHVKNKQAAKYYNFFKKNKLFYPFGFIFLGIRYIFYVLIGKRTALNIKKIIDDAENRKKIYQEFKLFERED